MSLLSVAWPMLAATSFTLAGVHLLASFRARGSRANLLFAVAAASAGAAALLELAMMRATSPAGYGELLRWLHVPVAMLIITLVWFIRYHLQAGRNWLAWTIVLLRVSILVVNLSHPPNATYREITALGKVSFLGEMVSVPEGNPSPFRILAQASSLLLLWYVIDATIMSRRRSDRGQVLIIGIAVSCAVIMSMVFSQLMAQGLLPGPLIGFSFLLIVVALSYELSSDIVRAKEQDAILSENQKRMNLAARAVDLQMWEWDIERDLVWTPGESGTLSEDADGRPGKLEEFLQTIHRGDRETVRRAVSEAVDHTGEIDLVYRVLMPDETTRWVATSGQVERDAHGRPIFMRGVSRDVTEQKEMQDEFTRQRDALLHLQRASSMEQLSYALAHELNQPLGAILRNAEAAELFLQKQPPDLDEVLAILADIRRDDQRASEVIDRMRGLLKRHPLDFQDLAIGEVIGEVEAIIQAEFQLRRASLRTEIMRGLPHVRGDRVQLQQVLLNLLLNSLDAIGRRPNGDSEVVIRAFAREDGAIEVAVTDRGGGIPSDRIDQIFEPFVTFKSKSMGVGLSICKNIIDAHGGRIWAENNPDGGSTFRFTLPPLSE